MLLIKMDIIGQDFYEMHIALFLIVRAMSICPKCPSFIFTFPFKI